MVATAAWAMPVRKFDPITERATSRHSSSNSRVRPAPMGETAHIQSTSRLPSVRTKKKQISIIASSKAKSETAISTLCICVAAQRPASAGRGGQGAGGLWESAAGPSSRCCRAGRAPSPCSPPRSSACRAQVAASIAWRIASIASHDSGPRISSTTPMVISPALRYDRFHSLRVSRACQPVRVTANTVPISNGFQMGENTASSSTVEPARKAVVLHQRRTTKGDS